MLLKGYLWLNNTVYYDIMKLKFDSVSQNSRILAASMLIRTKHIIVLVLSNDTSNEFFFFLDTSNIFTVTYKRKAFKILCNKETFFMLL